MTATCLAGHDEPLLRPTPNDLALAPELGVLAALDATLATAAYQLMAEHPDLGLDSLARGDLPSPEACKANHLCIRCTNRVFRSLRGDGRLASWKRRLVQRDGACSCGGGGIVRGPTSLASSTGSRRARVAAQYLGASSR